MILAKLRTMAFIKDNHNSTIFNAILAAASINEAIEYYNLFKEAQENCRPGCCYLCRKTVQSHCLRHLAGFWTPEYCRQGKDTEHKNSEVEQLDFEFVLFSSVLIDYDYIMALIARYTQAQSAPQKQKVTKEGPSDPVLFASSLSSLNPAAPEDRWDFLRQKPYGRLLHLGLV